MFGQKLLNTECCVGTWAHKSPTMKWANMLTEPSKKFTASHNNTSWYTDTDGFLEHSSSGGNLYYKGLTLQKIIPDSLGSPPPYIKNSYNLIAKKPQTI